MMEILTIVCIVHQVIDGILTYLGVTTLPAGINAEGNILVRETMRYLGIVPGIALFKIWGICVLIQIYRAGPYIKTLWFICGLYSLSSLVWIFVLFSHLV
jgi:hypothetical protein